MQLICGNKRFRRTVMGKNRWVKEAHGKWTAEEIWFEKDDIEGIDEKTFKYFSKVY